MGEHRAVRRRAAPRRGRVGVHIRPLAIRRLAIRRLGRVPRVCRVAPDRHRGRARLRLRRSRRTRAAGSRRRDRPRPVARPPRARLGRRRRRKPDTRRSAARVARRRVPRPARRSGRTLRTGSRGAGAAPESQCCGPQAPPTASHPQPKSEPASPWQTTSAKVTQVRARWSCGGRRCWIGGSWSRRCVPTTGRRSSRWPTGRGGDRWRSSCGRAGRDVAFVHSDDSDAQRTAAWKRATQGSCVVVGGRVAALAPVPDLARRDRRRRRRRSSAGRTVADLARTRRAPRAGRARGCTVVGRVARADCRGARDRRGCSSMRNRPTSEARGWPRTLVVDRREEPPGAGLLNEIVGRHVARCRWPGGMRAQPPGPIPRVGVRFVSRIAPLGPRRRSPDGVRRVRSDAPAGACGRA